MSKEELNVAMEKGGARIEGRRYEGGGRETERRRNICSEVGRGRERERK